MARSGGDAQRRGLLTWTVLAVLGGCSASLSSADDEGSFDGSGAQPGTGGTAGSGGTGGTPPEREDEESFTAPALDGRFIWTANPASGRVALIDARNVRVRTASAGLTPTHLAALRGASEDESGAIVINSGSQDVSVFRAENGEIVSSEVVPLGAAANRLSVSESTRYAVAWSDEALYEVRPDPTEGLQDVTVIDLEPSPPRSRRLTVGYRPNRVFVSETHVYVVAEPSVSVIELGGDDTARVLRDVAVTLNPTEAPNRRDVTVTPGGELFMVRREDSPTIDIVALSGGRRASLTLSGPVTDLDLSPDGTVAYAVVRGQPGDVANGGGGERQGEPGTGGTGSEPGVSGSGGDAGEAGAGSAGEGASGGVGGEGGEAGGGGTGTGGTGGSGPVESTVAFLDVGRLLDAPAVQRSVAVRENVASIVVAPEGNVAVLYTNAVASERVVVLDTERREQRPVVLHGPVRTVVPGPDGEHAVVLMSQAPGSQNLGSFALLPLKTNLPPKIVGTPSPPTLVSIGTRHALVTMSARGAPGAANTLPNALFLAQLPDFGTRRVDLGGVPLAAGLVPDEGVGFVAQEHPDGRITFVSLASGDPRTITGFELGSRVVTDD